MALGTSTPPDVSPEHDLLLVGGGLQNGLIALACWARHPAMRIGLVERDPTLGGNHTWCAHAGDLPADALGFVEPLITHRYPRYDVRFPGFGRTVQAPYAAITSQRFHRVLCDAFEAHAGSTLVLGRSVHEVHGDHVVLGDGTVLRAPLVIDARGPASLLPHAHAEHADAGARESVHACGYQKFIGLELRLREPHALPHPILMDATVPQDDGFRFFYVLPMGADRLLVEDTFFSRSPALDEPARVDAVLSYARRFGIVDEVLRQERGVLPMPWRSVEQAAPAQSPMRAGYSGGFFHPATGYSFPIALRLACHVAAHFPSVFGEPMRALHREHRSQARYAQRLNGLLFHAFPPAAMWNVFARFYRFPEALIARFYALQMTPLDRVRILVGRPPRGLSIAYALSRSSGKSSSTNAPHNGSENGRAARRVGAL